MCSRTEEKKTAFNSNPCLVYIYPRPGDNVQEQVQSLYVGVVNSQLRFRGPFVVIEQAGNFSFFDWNKTEKIIINVTFKIRIYIHQRKHTFFGMWPLSLKI
jgi:hypothetical protein